MTKTPTILWLLLLLAGNLPLGAARAGYPDDSIIGFTVYFVVWSAIMLLALAKAPYPSSAFNWAQGCFVPITILTAIGWLSPHASAPDGMLLLNTFLFPIAAIIIGIRSRASWAWE